VGLLWGLFGLEFGGQGQGRSAVSASSEH